MGQLQSNPDESIGDDSISIAVGVADDSIAVNGGFTANDREAAATPPNPWTNPFNLIRMYP